mgnify:CR=1 FL=1
MLKFYHTIHSSKWIILIIFRIILTILLTKKDTTCYNAIGGVIMKTSADITAVINALRTVSHVGICYYDLKNFFNYYQTGVKANHGHYCDFCNAAKDLPDGRRACDKSDKMDAVALADQYRQPFFFECHLGMRELVLPLLRENTLIGIIFIGQCRIEGETNEKLILQRVKESGGDVRLFAEYLQKLPVLTREKLRSISLILSHYFDIRIEHTQPIGLPDPSRTYSLAKRAHDYIDHHYSESISTSIIAGHFFVSPAHLSRAFRSAFGMTVTDYIHNVRIEHAKHLLSVTSASVSSIALNVGYPDVNYFSRIFKTKTGIIPTHFRKSQS